MQMNERSTIKRNLQERDMVEEMYLTEKAMKEFDEKERLRAEHLNKIKNDNLRALQYQIDEKRRRQLNEDKMNINEANLNNYMGTNIDYEKPSEVYGTSVPGLGMSHERKRQLNMIDKNLERGQKNTENMTMKLSKGALRGQNLLMNSTNSLNPNAVQNNNPQNTGGQNPPYQPKNLHKGTVPEGDEYRTEYDGRFNYGQPRAPLKNFSQIQKGGEIAPSWSKKPRNDYEFIKGKNGHNSGTFNIISNKMKRY